MAWELLTDVFGLDGDRLWVTVHEGDDEAERIWVDTVGVRPDDDTEFYFKRGSAVSREDVV